MKHLCLVYFTHAACSYTPLDWAYLKAKIAEVYPDINVELRPILVPGGGAGKKESHEFMEQAGRELAKLKADLYLMELDSVLWSTMFYAHGAIVVAEKIKQINPEATLGFHSHKLVDAFVKKLFREISTLDFCVRGEIENSFLKFLETKRYEKVPGFVYRQNELLKINAEVDLLEDLDQLPSPYLSGVLDYFIAEQNGGSFFMATTRGCPFKCHYCHRSARFSKVRKFSVERVLDEIEYLMERGAKKIFMLDDCFIVDHQHFFNLVAAYEVRFKETELVLPKLSIMCRPEFLSDRVIEALPRLNVVWVQVGIQTLNPACHFLIGRGCKEEDFQRISDKLWEQDVYLHLDLIIGLPHDTLEYFKKSFDFAIDLRPLSLQVKQLFRNPNTLFDLYPEKYGIKTEATKQLFNVPVVQSSNTFSNQAIEKATEYVLDYRNRNLFPRIKLVTEFVRFDDFKQPSPVFFSTKSSFNSSAIMLDKAA